MTNNDILQLAMRQSAIDSGCAPEDFLSQENKVVLSRPHPQARKYLSLPFSCDLTYYGNGIVASVSPELAGPVREFLDKYPPEHCFETPNMHELIRRLTPFGLNICFMAEYFLPDVTVLKALNCPYETRLLSPADFSGLYLPEWSNALCEKRKHLDAIGIGAYDGEKLIALAGASADCESMWQIGIDVLPEYRRQGIASALTAGLALEILDRGRAPFYCSAWSNVKSVRNAIRSGFRPAWVQMTAKSAEYIDEMNK